MPPQKQRSCKKFSCEKCELNAAGKCGAAHARARRQKITPNLCGACCEPKVCALGSTCHHCGFKDQVFACSSLLKVLQHASPDPFAAISDLSGTPVRDGMQCLPFATRCQSSRVPNAGDERHRNYCRYPAWGVARGRRR